MELANVTKLNNQNYRQWAFKAQMLLTRESTWRYIEPGNRPDPITDAWQEGDAKARATIALLVEDNQHDLIMKETSAKSTWDTLKRHHEKATLTGKVSLLREICSATYKPGDNMEQFLYGIQDLYARLENSGEKLSKYMQVAMILRSLPKSFDGLTTALESRSDEELTIELVKTKLIDESEKLRDREKLPASMALAPMKEHSEEKQRELVKALRDLKAELKEERKQRAAAVAAKKRLEGDLLDTEAILEVNNKLVDTMQMRVKLQGKVMKLQQQLNQDKDEAGRALKTELMSDSNLPLEEHQLRFAPEAAKPEEKEIAATVNKANARATRVNDELVVEHRRDADGAEVRRNIEELTGKAAATVRHSTEMAVLEFTGVDLSATVDDICHGMRKAGVEVSAGDVMMRRCRDALHYVRVRLPVRKAKPLVGTRVEFCFTKRLARLADPVQGEGQRCFRCLMKGHLAQHCRATVDRRDCCYKCGVAGHIAAGCASAAKCLNCGGPHSTGSTNCRTSKRR